MKNKVISVGTGNGLLDNVLTLINSNNDIYDGCIDYIFFRVLNLKPIEYFNLTEQEFEEPFTDKDIDTYQKNYDDFENKNNFSNKIKEDLEKIISYIREKSLNEKVIKEKFKNKYIEASLKYDAKYIKKKIIKFYKES